MKKLVVTMESLEFDKALIRVEETHKPIAGRKTATVDWSIEAPQRDTDFSVYGTELMDALKLNEAFLGAFNDLSHPNSKDICPIYIKLGIETPDMELHWWESLHDITLQPKFVSLNSRIQVARMIHISELANDRFVEAQIRSDRPLRLSLVLSALNEKADNEWRNIRDSIERIQETLPVEVQVIVGEEDLEVEIAELKKTKSWIKQVICVPNSVVELKIALDDFEPHLVHFFCHGTSAQEQPRLEIATYNDWQTQKQKASLELYSTELLMMSAITNAWLVTLNCCQGGTASELVHSLAFELVGRGVYSCVGVMEPLSIVNANKMSKFLFRNVFKLIQAAHASACSGVNAELDFAQILHDFRSSMVAEPRACAAPVVYRQPKSIFLTPPKTGGAEPVKAAVNSSSTPNLAYDRTIAEFLAKVDPSTRGKFQDVLDRLKQLEPVSE